MTVSSPDSNAEAVPGGWCPGLVVNVGGCGLPVETEDYALAPLVTHLVFGRVNLVLLCHSMD